MLDHLEGDGQIEGSRCQRETCGGRLEELDVRERIVRLRISHGFCREVEAYNAASLVRELGGTVSGTAANIEYLLAGGKSRRESVARSVFSPEVIADRTWDDTFAGELNHGTATP